MTMSDLAGFNQSMIDTGEVRLSVHRAGQGAPLILLDIPVEAATTSPDDAISFVMRLHLNLSDADFARMESELRELVLLRNNLVHHFIDQHDIGTLDGCRGAQDALVAAYSRIDQHVEQLRSWAETMWRCQGVVAEFVQSDVFRDWMVNGIRPGDTAFGPDADIVRAFGTAAGELAVDGWAPVAEAERWISERHPGQLPAKHGCSSWRQVLHESRRFEIRYFEIDRRRSAWYRERQDRAKSR